VARLCSWYLLEFAFVSFVSFVLLFSLVTLYRDLIFYYTDDGSVALYPDRLKSKRDEKDMGEQLQKQQKV
jgi:hypothetical protein